jgi:hypothetical protein
MPNTIKVHSFNISAENYFNISSVLNEQMKENKIKDDNIINIQIEKTQFLLTVYIFYRSYHFDK